MSIQPFKGRDPYDATRVAVYRNLHGNVWSLLAMDGRHKGQIVAHAKQVQLDLPVFRVNPAGQARVRETRQKNVHAFVIGMIRDTDVWPDYLELERVTYNPYTMATFGLADAAFPTPVDAARIAVFDDRGKLWAA